MEALEQMTARWRADAVRVLTRPAEYTASQIELAWRFLQQWGVKNERPA